MIDIITAILAIDPSSQLSIGSNDINDIRWHDGNPNNITNEEILVKQTELQAEYDAQEYARNRQAEYPALSEQLDEIYHNGIDSWKAVIKVTKDKYPKG
jgi:hypothetical protein